MSEIVFEELTLQNFGSIAEATLALEGRGLLLIQGDNQDDGSANSNGAGKSWLIDGLSWVLYGTTARGVTGDSVVNRVAGKNCYGRVTFRDGTDQYEVLRHRKHSKHKNRLLLIQNGVDITKGTDKLTQDALNKIIGCTHEVFVASIYAGQEQLPNLPAMTDKELKTLIEDAAGGKVLELAYEIARDRKSQAERTALAIGEERRRVAQTVTDAEGRIERAQKQSANWRAERLQKIEAQTTALASDTARVRKIKAEIAAVDESAVKTRIEDTLAKLQAIKDFTPPDAPMPTFATRTLDPPRPKEGSLAFELALESGKLERLVGDIDMAKRVFAHELGHLADRVGSACGECGKTYAAEDLERRKGQIAAQARALNRDRAELSQKLEDCQKRLNAAKQEDERRLQTWERVCKQNAEEYETECARLRAEYEIALEAHKSALAAKRAELAALDTSSLMRALERERETQKRLDVLRNEATCLLATAKLRKDRIEELRAEVDPHRAEIESATKEHENLCSLYEETALKHDEACRKLDVAKAAVEVFAPDGVRGEILDTVTPFLNDRTAMYLGALSDGNITAQWSTIGSTGKGELREKFHIAVDNSKGADSFEGLSGGERRKVRLATAMALQDLVASRAYKPIRLFAADEVDDALDVSGLERLMGLLEEKARTTGTVLLVSHNDLGMWCREQVTMVKKGGVSCLAA